MQFLAGELMESGGFTGEPWKMDDKMVYTNDDTQAAVSMGSGAAAEEIARYTLANGAAGKLEFPITPEA